MNNDTYDLVVVGAGPAGALAAATAAKAGIRTIILEQNSFPRQKLCGGFISARALSLLPDDFYLPPGSAEPVYRLSIIKKNKSYSYQSTELLGHLVQRSSFDQLLAAYASRQGALLVEKSSLKKIEYTQEKADPGCCYILRFRVDNDMVAIKTRYLIAADGALGRCAELGGIDRQIRKKICGWGLAEMITAQEDQDFAPGNPALLKIYPLPFKGGMGWAFHGNGWLNRGVGGFCGRKELFTAYTQLFGTFPEKSTLRSWPLPFLGPVSKVAKGNLLLIGDAAGLIEPFSGEGLYNCFKSARLAVQAIREAKTAGQDAAVTYNRLFKTHFRRYFLPTLAGTVMLHTQSLLYPSAVPQQIARLIENRLWFNDHNFDPQ